MNEFMNELMNEYEQNILHTQILKKNQTRDKH